MPASTTNYRQLCAGAWPVGLAVIYLFGYNAWLLPAQLISCLAADLPAWKVGPFFGQFISGRLWDAGCVAAILATAFALGAPVVARCSDRRDLLTMLLAVGVGLWWLAVAVLAVGAVSTARVPWCLALGVAWLWPGPRRFVREFWFVTGRISGWAKFLLGCAMVAAVLNLPGALAPPFEYDELEYHLGAPAEYLRAGHIVFLPHNFYSNLPQLTEMLYLLGWTAGSEVAPKLLHWAFGVLAALTVYATGARLWTRSAGVSAAALFYCLPFVQDLSQTARVDLATTFFAALAFGALLAWWREDEAAVPGAAAVRPPNDFVWLSALAAGGAVATKWTAVPVVLVPAVIVLAARRRFTEAIGFLLLAGLCVVPWLVKNWLLAGNPVYPLLASEFPSPHWSAAQAALFADRHYPTFGWSGLWGFFERAWRYSFAEPRAAPVLLMIAPLILLVSGRPASTGVAGGLLATGYAGWYLFTFRPWRFLMPVLPLAALVGAFALERVGWIARAAVGLVVVVALSSLALNDLVDVERPERMPAQVSFALLALGEVSRDELQARLGGGVFAPVVWMNKHLPAAAKVLYVGEARVALARHEVVWATAFDQHPLAPALGNLQQTGVTHIYLNFSELRRLQAGYGYLQDLNWSAFRQFLQQHARAIFRSDTGVVYELTDSSPRGGEDTGEGKLR